VLFYSNVNEPHRDRREEIWLVLQRAGVPVGAARPPDRRPDPALRAAVREVVAEADSLAPAERVALVAWLAAFRHHWPIRFAETLGDDGARLITALSAKPVDPNQYLKLRRIAVANLAAQD